MHQLEEALNAKLRREGRYAKNFIEGAIPSTMKEELVLSEKSPPEDF